MATLALSVVGSTVGGMFGGPVGAAIGRFVGATLGAGIDQSLFGKQGKVVDGPRLKELDAISSTEGAPIPRLYGRARISGQMIWATPLVEESTKESVDSGGGGKSNSSNSGNSIRRYHYYANFALALCEGPISSIGRVWADGQELDTRNVTMRVYVGDANQPVDPLIQINTKNGIAPAYRHLAYVVFERLHLESFGNRIPQLSFEVFRSVGSLEQKIEAVCIIPGAGEFVYDTTPVRNSSQAGAQTTENQHQLTARTDWEASLDQLQSLCPNLKQVALVVSWFGDDLRLAQCQLTPRVDSKVKQTDGDQWRVAGVDRLDARSVSYSNGRPAYGGTPSDASVMRAIADLKKRGLKVVLYPFILMDIPKDNALPNPYGASTQGPYPWRGLISCYPAPCQPGTPDGTAQITDDVKFFFGYGGGNSHGLQQMVTHYATLAANAGGVDGFLIGSELRGITTLRDNRNSYPAAQELCRLAASVRSILGSKCKITYAADWSEYGAHVPQGQPMDVGFPLDQLWADNNIDMIGIDYYPPLGDWRDDVNHRDFQIWQHPLGGDYIKSQIEAGEGYDWYYANDEDRLRGDRTPITDGAYGKNWIFRQKDVYHWWSEPHFPRKDGQELALPTQWQPSSKPVWLTEIGVAAVDKGYNRPSSFPDPKSASSSIPPFSTAERDDTTQRHVLGELIDYWNGGGKHGAEASHGMMESSGVFVWAWDARPFPSFPALNEVWADGEQYNNGHWLNGRLGAMSLADLVQQIAIDFDLNIPIDLGDLIGNVTGYLIDHNVSPRGALQQLALVYGFTAVEKADGVRFIDLRRYKKAQCKLLESDYCVQPRKARITKNRSARFEPPEIVHLAYIEATGDYRQRSASAYMASMANNREATAETALVLNHENAHNLSKEWLDELWNSRTRITFSLPIRYLNLEVGDVVEIEDQDDFCTVQIMKISRGTDIMIEAIATGHHLVKAQTRGSNRPTIAPAQPIVASAKVQLFNLPLAKNSHDLGYFATGIMKPWDGPVGLFLRRGAGEYRFLTQINQPATQGTTLTKLMPGPLWIWDHQYLEVQLESGQIFAKTPDDVLSGANIAALGNPSQGYEIIQFERAELIGKDRYRLKNLLRGQQGTESLCQQALPIGSQFVFVNDALCPIDLPLDMINLDLEWLAQPLHLPIHDPRASYVQGKCTAIAQRPFRPVHARAERFPDFTRFSWIPRRRYDADNWNFQETQFTDKAEKYHLEIMSDEESNSLNFEVEGNSFELSSVHECSTFGTRQSGYKLRIEQINSLWGRGEILEVKVNVRQISTS